MFPYYRLGRYKKDKPIILDIGGENSLTLAASSGRDASFSDLLVELSEQHEVALLSVEHRYYGWKNVFPSDKTEGLKWLTTE